ncbi:hypothetical protein [Micromonospora sp. NPDC049497]|uniref:hypothetical protein n=1 Tax=Micromonospora sp. NPDC049497 TaxID=3364273 RepID=UPI0037A9BC69
MSALRNLSSRLYVAVVLATVATVALTQFAGGDGGSAVLAEGFGWIAPASSGPVQS